MKKGITSFVHSDAILVSLNIYGDWPADERLKKIIGSRRKEILPFIQRKAPRMIPPISRSTFKQKVFVFVAKWQKSFLHIGQHSSL